MFWQAVGSVIALTGFANMLNAHETGEITKPLVWKCVVAILVGVGIYVGVVLL